MFGEPTFADAILDRIVHNAYRLELDGPSMRKLKAAEASRNPHASGSAQQTEPELRPAKQVSTTVNSPAAKPARESRND